MTSQDAIEITGVWFCSNHTGTRIDVKFEIDGEWRTLFELPGNGQGLISHIIEPLGIRNILETGNPCKV